MKSNTTGDVFEGVTPGAIAFAPKSGYRPLPRDGISLQLGGPWAFYREFWRAQNIEHLAELVTPEVGVAGGQPLNVPLLIVNETGQAKVIRLMTELPEGWTEQMRFAEFPVAAHETYPVQLVLNSPVAHANEWQVIRWKIEAEGKAAGSVELRVHLRSGGLPQ